MLWDFVAGFVVGVVGFNIFSLKKKARDGESQTDPPVPKTNPIPVPQGIPYLRNFWFSDTYPKSP